MSASTLARFFVLLTLAASTPAPAAGSGACEHALAKASAKFVGAAFKTAQRCVALKGAGKLPSAACQLVAVSTGDSHTDAALAHAESRLRQGLGPCSDTALAGMGFDASCPASGGSFGRADLQHCIADTHMRAVQALVSVQMPQEASTCGNGVVDLLEDCDPVANPTDCLEDETCVPAGSADECTCIETGTSTCGDGTKDAAEACDPAALPTGCPTGMTCGAAGQAGECTCTNGTGTSQCEGTCTPTCATGQTCNCHCLGGTCGNGTKEAGEQCDPMANPSGCAAGLICGAPGNAQQCTCFTQGGTCGNGMLDQGEACDPALPNTCDPGEVCLSSGAMACTCGAPPSNCGNGVVEWGEQCDPSANPTGCPTGQTCGARDTATACTCSTGGSAMCGNGTVDAGEACDPAATPTGCTAQQTCSGQCTCSGGGATCGNGTIDAGEACDPAANPQGCPAGMTCSATCTCGGGGGACACGATAPTKLSFTTSIGTGNCGTIRGNTGTVTKQLKCSGLYTGGGSNTVPLPYAVPDMGTSLTKVAACSGTSITLGNLTMADTGSNRNCTSAGCLFGPPLPIPNAGSPPTSVCVINKVATNGTGTVDCSTGESTLNLPLTSVLYLTGDIVPTVAGVQPCPICTGGTCKGGPNNNQPCTPADSASLGDAFPTSHDCPPPEALNIGGLPIAFNLTTGTQVKTAVNNTTSGQNNVFCGFCRDLNGAGTGCFAGDPSPACPAGGSTFKTCTSNADCDATFPDCEQRNPGAFGPAGGGARTITESGSPSGSLVDGAPHASTLVSIFCIPPTFNPTVDAAGDLPGPGAVSLSGMAQLLP